MNKRQRRRRERRRRHPRAPERAPQTDLAPRLRITPADSDADGHRQVVSLPSRRPAHRRRQPDLLEGLLRQLGVSEAGEPSRA
jgi:hypothetical protein